MAIKILSMEDVAKIQNPTHRSIVSGYMQTVMMPIWEEAAELYGSEANAVQEMGFPVYLETAKDVAGPSDELYMDNSGVYHIFRSSQTDEPDFVSWESAKWHENEKLLEVLWLRDNDFGITYFIPEELDSERLRKASMKYIEEMEGSCESQEDKP